MRFNAPMWVALLAIPGGWVVCYFLGQLAQAHGLGFF